MEIYLSIEKKKKKLCDRKENIFVGIIRMFDIAQYFSIVLFPFFFNTNPTKQTTRRLESIYNSKDFHLRFLFVPREKYCYLHEYANKLNVFTRLHRISFTFNARDKFPFRLQFLRIFKFLKKIISTFVQFILFFFPFKFKKKGDPCFHLTFQKFNTDIPIITVSYPYLNHDIYTCIYIKFVT